MKLCIVSLGCSKNTVDSENLIGLLEASGVEIVSDVGDADVALVNTCGFIQPAVEESVSAILDLELLKEQGKLKKIGVVGCLVNRYGNELKKELPSVDVWARAEEWGLAVRSLGLIPAAGPARGMLPETKPWTRYLKVGEGCDTFCSYCTIPSIRGRARSIGIPELSSMALDLAEKGAREICLVGETFTESPVSGNCFPNWTGSFPKTFGSASCICTRRESTSLLSISSQDTAGFSPIWTSPSSMSTLKC